MNTNINLNNLNENLVSILSNCLSTELTLKFLTEKYALINMLMEQNKIAQENNNPIQPEIQLILNQQILLLLQYKQSLNNNSLFMQQPNFVNALNYLNLGLNLPNKMNNLYNPTNIFNSTFPQNSDSFNQNNYAVAQNNSSTQQFLNNRNFFFK